MKFSHNNRSVDFQEANGTWLKIAYWNENPGSYGAVDLDEEHLGKLINWLRSQHEIIKKNKKAK